MIWVPRSRLFRWYVLFASVLNVAICVSMIREAHHVTWSAVGVSFYSALAVLSAMSLRSEP